MEARRLAVPTLRLLVHHRRAAGGRLERGRALLGGARTLEQLVAIPLELGLVRVGVGARAGARVRATVPVRMRA
jgi:hypothetical protein